MINKPSSYDKSEAYTGDFETLLLGGHICEINAVKVDDHDTWKQLIVCFDIVEGENKGFYKRQYDRKKGQDPNAKWSGVVRQGIPTNDGSDKDAKTIGFFKGLIMNIEKSNPGYVWNWEEKTLVGKKFGGVFGQEEFVAQDGTTRLATKCVQVRTVDAVRAGVEVPAIKKLKETAPAPAWGNIPDDDTKLPFDI